MRTCLLLSTLSTAWSLPALACDVPEDAAIYVPSQVPQGGAVSFGYCLGDCTRVRVEVHDAAGALVRGSLMHDGEHLRWQPEQPLELAARYALMATGLNASSTGGTFEVVERVTPFDEGVQRGSMQLEAALVDTGTACCYSLTLPPETCRPVAPVSCMATYQEGRVKVAVAMTNLEAKSGQWVYFGKVGSRFQSQADELTPANGFRFEAAFGEPQAQYCVSVDAISLVGDELVRVYEECRDVDLALPTTTRLTAKDVERYRADCEAGGAGRLNTTGQVPRPRDEDGDEEEGPPPDAMREPTGCQLRDEPAGIVGLLLLGLLARKRRGALLAALCLAWSAPALAFQPLPHGEVSVADQIVPGSVVGGSYAASA